MLFRSIRRCYYQSEEDATEFALNRETRKKNYGLEYDVRAEALVNSGEEETEEDMIS